MTAGATLLAGCLPSRSPAGRTYAGSSPSLRERLPLRLRRKPPPRSRRGASQLRHEQQILCHRAAVAHACGGPARLGALGPRDGSRAPPQPKTQTSCAAAALAHVRGVGPYWAKNAINTLFAHGFLEFDLGVVGPGALATLAWLRGGEGTLPSLGFWQTAQAPVAAIARQGMARLSEMEPCHWLGTQHALCLWRSSDAGGPTR